MDPYVSGGKFLSVAGDPEGIKRPQMREHLRPPRETTSDFGYSRLGASGASDGGGPLDLVNGLAQGGLTAVA